MKKNNIQLGEPERLFKDSKANIEAISNPVEGWAAYAEDTKEIGFYNNSVWKWYSFSPSDIKLDSLGSPDDNTNLNTSGSKHGLAPKGTSGSLLYWRQDWVLSAPEGATHFTYLSDTFPSYAGLADQYIKVKHTEDGLETGIPEGGSGSSVSKAFKIYLSRNFK